LKILKEKYLFNPDLKLLLRWKKMVIVDDSVVRWTTLEFLIQAIEEFYEPSEIHVRIPSPPIIWPCYYAINLKHPSELIARRFFIDPQNPTDKELERLANTFWAGSINYLKVSQLLDALKLPDNEMCTWCVTGNYPTLKWKEIFQQQLQEKQSA
jgi:amidophosphoribosyltransferase